MLLQVDVLRSSSCDIKFVSALLSGLCVLDEGRRL